MCYVIQKFSHLSNEASVDFYNSEPGLAIPEFSEFCSG